MSSLSSVLDKVSLAVRIQAHPSRSALLDDLLPRLDGLDPVVVTDPGGRIRSTWRCHRLCLESVPDDADWLCVLQDDALPCDGFPAAVHAAIAERPDRILCLFVPGSGPLLRRITLARKNRERWFDLMNLSYTPTVAIIYPAAVAREIPPFAERKKIPIGRTDDAVIAMYVRAHRLVPCAPMPSLVEHRDEVPSVCGMPSGAGLAHRRAAWFEPSPLVLADPIR